MEKITKREIIEAQENEIKELEMIIERQKNIIEFLKEDILRCEDIIFALAEKGRAHEAEIEDLNNQIDELQENLFVTKVFWLVVGLVSAAFVAAIVWIFIF